MALRAGFAEVDISPSLGALKVGWIRKIVIDEILDPIFARAAVLLSDAEPVGFIQLDVICVRWTEVAEIRRRIETRYGVPGPRVMVAATHNHAGPAVASLGEVPRDAPYIEGMVDRAVAAFGHALAGARLAEIGIGSALRWDLSHNRRVVMRDGTVRTHSGYGSPDALYVEGPIDPEVVVLAARSAGGLLGAIVLFACHPTHHGGDTVLSAGFPGALAHEMKARGCPVTLFLNGAAGNLSPGDPCSGRDPSMGAMGRALADDAGRAIASMIFRPSLHLGARSRIVSLPFREITEAETRGMARGAQRFVDPAIYDRAMPALVEKIRRQGVQLAEIQALFLDEYAFVSSPAELFVQLGVRIKEACHPRRALPVGFANGYIGYAPHREAFERGGFETTFGWGSRLAPGAAESIADASVELVTRGPVR